MKMPLNWRNPRSWRYSRCLTPDEKLCRNQRALNRAIRELDQERMRMECEEQNLISNIREMARLNRKDTVHMLAQDLVRTRKCIKKFMEIRANAQAVATKITTIRLQNEVSMAMNGVTSAMRRMNSYVSNKCVRAFRDFILKLHWRVAELSYCLTAPDSRQYHVPAVQNILDDFEQQSMTAAADGKEETVDNAPVEASDDEEADAMVAQIYDELGLQNGQLPALSESPSYCGSPECCPQETGRSAWSPSSRRGKRHAREYEDECTPEPLPHHSTRSGPPVATTAQPRSVKSVVSITKASTKLHPCTSVTRHHPHPLQAQPSTTTTKSHGNGHASGSASAHSSTRASASSTNNATTIRKVIQQAAPAAGAKSDLVGAHAQTKQQPTSTRPGSKRSITITRTSTTTVRKPSRDGRRRSREGSVTSVKPTKSKSRISHKPTKSTTSVVEDDEQTDGNPEAELLAPESATCVKSRMSRKSYKSKSKLDVLEDEEQTDGDAEAELLTSESATCVKSRKSKIKSKIDVLPMDGEAEAELPLLESVSLHHGRGSGGGGRGSLEDDDFSKPRAGTGAEKSSVKLVVGTKSTVPLTSSVLPTSKSQSKMPKTSIAPTRTSTRTVIKDEDETHAVQNTGSHHELSGAPTSDHDHGAEQSANAKPTRSRVQISTPMPMPAADAAEAVFLHKLQPRSRPRPHLPKPQTIDVDADCLARCGATAQPHVHGHHGGHGVHHAVRGTGKCCCCCGCGLLNCPHYYHQG